MALSTETRPVEHTSAPENVRRLTRSPNDRVIAGLCGGLGAYFEVDPVWFRIAFATLVLAGAGGGVILYAIAWIAIPMGSKTRSGGRSAHVAAVFGVVLIAVGLTMISAMLIPWAGDYLLPGLVIAVGVAVLASEVTRGDRA